MNKQQLILLTGGHMTPALAVYSELKGRGYTNFLWVGHKYNQFGTRRTSAEFSEVSELGIRFIDLKAGKLSRSWDDWRAGIVNLLKIPWGFIHALWIILRYQPALVMSFGGYLALPLAIWGKLLGKKVITHEQTVVTGLTNRIIPKFADKVLITWPSSAKYYPADKTVLTGNPLRPEIFASNSNRYNFPDSLPLIYITGGNQGSHKLNKAVFTILPELLQITNVLHQTGNSTQTGDAETAVETSNNLPADLQARYIPQAFFGQEVIGEVFAKTNLIVSRSGANLTYETLALGIPSIFIPIPWVTHNEQYHNAKTAADTGIATILTEAELTPQTLLTYITVALERLERGMAFDNNPITTAKAHAHQVVRLDAARVIVDNIEDIIK